MNCSAIIRQISRANHSGHGLKLDEAHYLFTQMLDGKIPDMELGALILAFRIRTESIHEIMGFHQALCERMKVIDGTGLSVPVILPTYNGARHHVNLTPLIALILQRMNIPVLLHGSLDNYGRVTSAKILKEHGIMPADSLEEAVTQLRSRNIAYIQPQLVYPGIERILGYRERLGVRNSAHTVVKLMDPFRGHGLRLVAASHPEYLEKLKQVVLEEGGHALLFRATQGEPYVNPLRRPRLIWLHDGNEESLFETDSTEFNAASSLPEQFDAAETSRWMKRVLKGCEPIPEPILWEVSACLFAAGYVMNMGDARVFIETQFRIQPDKMRKAIS